MLKYFYYKKKYDLSEKEKNYLIYQYSYTKGIELPCFCYNENLEIAGNCRMCFIEKLFKLIIFYVKRANTKQYFFNFFFFSFDLNYMNINWIDYSIYIQNILILIFYISFFFFVIYNIFNIFNNYKYYFNYNNDNKILDNNENIINKNDYNFEDPEDPEDPKDPKKKKWYENKKVWLSISAVAIITIVVIIYIYNGGNNGPTDQIDPIDLLNSTEIYNGGNNDSTDQIDPTEILNQYTNINNKDIDILHTINVNNNNIVSPEIIGATIGVGTSLCINNSTELFNSTNVPVDNSLCINNNTELLSSTNVPVNSDKIFFDYLTATTTEKIKYMDENSALLNCYMIDTENKNLFLYFEEMINNYEIQGEIEDRSILLDTLLHYNLEEMAISHDLLYDLMLAYDEGPEIFNEFLVTLWAINEL